MREFSGTDRFAVKRRLGSGGMGVVYEAEQQNPKRRVALKVIRGGLLVDPHRIKLFQRVTQTLGRLRHPGIGAIYEAGCTPDGQHFFAMELVGGETLDRYLRLIVVTPDMHRVHHSIEDDETNSNFGFNLPWWDRLFGTYRDQPRGGHEGMTIGLNQFRDPSGLTLPRLLLLPFVGKQGNYAINRRGGKSGQK